MTYNTQVTTPITTKILEAVRRSDSDFAEGQHSEACIGFLITEVYGRTIEQIFARYDVAPVDYVTDLTRRGVTGRWAIQKGIVDALSVIETPYWELNGKLSEAVKMLTGGPQ